MQPPFHCGHAPRLNPDGADLSSHPDVAGGGELGFWSAPQILKSRSLKPCRRRRGRKAHRQRLHRDAESIRSRCETSDGQGAGEFLPSRNYSPRAPQRHVGAIRSTQRSRSSPPISKPTSIMRRTAAILSFITGSMRGPWITGEAFCLPLGSSRWTTRRLSATPSRSLGGSSQPAVSSGTTRVWRPIGTPAGSPPQAFGRRGSRSIAVPWSVGAIRAVAGRAPGVVS